jgi:hypothetical protein
LGSLYGDLLLATNGNVTSVEVSAVIVVNIVIDCLISSKHLLNNKNINK